MTEEPRDADSIRTMYRITGLPMTAGNWDTMLDRIRQTIVEKYGQNVRLLGLVDKAREKEYSQPILDWLSTFPDAQGAQ